MNTQRLDLEDKIVKFFEDSNDEKKVRLFENILFQVPFETLKQIYVSEQIEKLYQDVESFKKADIYERH